MRSLALGLTGEGVITDSARREAEAEAARGGDGEPKALSSWRSALLWSWERRAEQRAGGHLVR